MDTAFEKWSARDKLRGAVAGSPVPAAVIVLVGLGLQIVGQQVCDNSRFITFAEKVYDGAVPYVDVADPNTPAAFLLYMPTVLAMKLKGLRAEAFVVVEIFALTAFTAWLAGRILRRAELINGSQAAVTRNAVLFASLIVWGAMFGEREHFAALLVLPMLAAGKPDVILIESAAIRTRELATTELVHALDDYHHAIDASGVEVWVRSDLPTTEARFAGTVQADASARP